MENSNLQVPENQIFKIASKEMSITPGSTDLGGLTP